MSSCKQAFASLAGRTGSIYDVLDTPVGYSLEASKKRPYLNEPYSVTAMTSGIATPGGRPLHPRPPISYVAESIARPSMYHHASTASPEGQQKRRRGRPPKVEAQAKAAAAAARGESYYSQPRKAPKPGGAGGEVVPVAATAMPGPSSGPVAIRSSEPSALRGSSTSGMHRITLSHPEPAERDVQMVEAIESSSAGESRVATEQSREVPTSERHERQKEPREQPTELRQDPPLEIRRESFREHSHEQTQEPSQERLPQPVGSRYQEYPQAERREMPEARTPGQSGDPTSSVARQQEHG